MSIYDHLEFKHFKYIVAIAEAGTFTAAAVRLPLAQSALSPSQMSNSHSGSLPSGLQSRWSNDISRPSAARTWS